MNTALRPTIPAGGRLTVDLAALDANWRACAATAGSTETAAAVKADAYGLGMDAVAPRLWRAGCRTFFVATPAEGVRLRALLPDAVVYVLNGFCDGTGPLLLAHRLRAVLGSLDDIDAFLAETGGAAEPPALHVDTGMNRLGLTMGEAVALAADGDRLAALRPGLVMSHLACADDPGHPMTALQIERFAAVRALFPGLPGSLANSAGLLHHPATRHDLVRPGIALYGGACGPASSRMRTVATLEARILQLRDVPAGETVGYGAGETVKRPTRVAVLSVGYADGYPRTAGGADGRPGADAAIGGRRVRLIGRVSMDLVAVDVTDLPDGLARRGAFVELFGPTIGVDEVAAAAGTIGYELLASVGRRVERRLAD